MAPRTDTNLDSGDLHQKLRGYLDDLNWDKGVTKDDIMERLAGKDESLRMMANQFIAEGTYHDMDDCIFRIPAEGWQSEQGDQWRGVESQYVEDVDTGFRNSPTGKDERNTNHSTAFGKTGKQAASNNSGKAQRNNGSQGGNPGDGAGRSGKAGSTEAGVFPASGPHPDDPDAKYQDMNSMGQGDRGAKGYKDSGESEVKTMPPKGKSSQGNSGGKSGKQGA